MICEIASPRHVVEMGAGRGYWAWMLSQVGCEVVAYEENVPPQWGKFKHQSHLFHPVNVGVPSSLRRHGDSTLLLVWPPLNDSMGVFKEPSHWLCGRGQARDLCLCGTN